MTWWKTIKSCGLYCTTHEGCISWRRKTTEVSFIAVKCLAPTRFWFWSLIGVRTWFDFNNFFLKVWKDDHSKFFKNWDGIFSKVWWRDFRWPPRFPGNARGDGGRRRLFSVSRVICVIAAVIVHCKCSLEAVGRSSRSTLESNSQNNF